MEERLTLARLANSLGGGNLRFSLRRASMGVLPVTLFVAIDVPRVGDDVERSARHRARYLLIQSTPDFKWRAGRPRLARPLGAAARTAPSCLKSSSGPCPRAWRRP